MVDTPALRMPRPLGRLVPALGLALTTLAPAPSAGAAPPAPSCESLASLRLPDLTVTVAETVASGTFTPPGEKPLTGLPAFCRVAGVLRPSADSHVEVEVWMPSAGWNRKFQGGGNGGFAGSIGWEGLARNVALG